LAGEVGRGAPGGTGGAAAGCVGGLYETGAGPTLCMRFASVLTGAFGAGCGIACGMGAIFGAGRGIACGMGAIGGAFLGAGCRMGILLIAPMVAPTLPDNW
jgi:hypothetical protein